MPKTPDNSAGSVFALIRREGIEGRIFRSMIIATTLATIASLPFARWRITTGLLVGGLLSLVNYHWLSRSSSAALSVVAHGIKPNLKLTQYILRYFVVGGVVFLAYKLNVVSLTATVAGLCSFVVALFVEAFREFYFAMVNREEIS